LKKNLKILICPLEWGRGHSARMIPMALNLIEMGHSVIIGTGKENRVFFQTETPQIQCIDFPGFKPRYSAVLPQYLMIAAGIPRLLFHIIAEHYLLRKIIAVNNIDMVISDNRFGLWNRKVKTVYVTHQIRIPFPQVIRFLEFTGIFLHRLVIRKFDYCLIPDLPGKLNLTGRLTHGMRLPDNVIFAGILSRFPVKKLSQDGSDVTHQYTTVILSGPEPQRTLLRHKTEKLLDCKGIKGVILGCTNENESGAIKQGNITIYSHLPGVRMQEVITGSRNIIARAGYTTIMELVSLNRSAVLIPTPGQTEQEYLAKRMTGKGWFSSISQKDLKNYNFPEALITHLPAREMISESNHLLPEALKKISEEDQNQGHRGKSKQKSRPHFGRSMLLKP